MFMGPQILAVVNAVLPPRQRFALRLKLIDRWQSFERAYHIIDDFIDPNRAALDVGANEGIYSGKFSKLAKSVHSFEPIPWFAAKLRTDLPSTVIVHEVAASDEEGEAILRIPYKDSIEQHGTTTIEQGNPLQDADEVKEVVVRRATLDQLVNEPVGFIKIDVEGHELSVLKGAQGILIRDKPVIQVESEQRHFETAPFCIISYLETHGYTGTVLFGDHLFSLQGFDVLKHQNVENLTKGQHKFYANTFIFFPPLTE